tara:strand:+ start:460 stop:1071 length:612 start_codon:yes stop_codon:yes gene_type:complete
MVIVLAAALLARRQWPNQRELSRKIVHIGTGAVIPMAWWFAIPAPIAIPFAGVVTLATAINQRWRLIPAVEDVDRNSYGTTAYGLAITALLMLFWPSRPDAVCAGVLVMACGDGLAGLIGRAVTSPRWSVAGQTKSLAGTTTMLMISFSVLLALSITGGSGANWTVALLLSVVATGLEQLSPAGIDNLSVPLVVGCLWVATLN